MTKKDNIQFRILYFIGMFLIVATHANSGSIDLLYNWFPAGTFHLGLFVFCSGYFFLNNIKKSSKEIIVNKIKKLLIPLYLWNLIYGVIITILHRFGIEFGFDLSLKTLFLSPIYDGHQFMLNLASWFIVPLFVVQVLNIPIIKFLDNKSDKVYCLYFIVCLLFGFLGIQLAINGYNTEWWLFIVRLCYFLPFFVFGMLYRKFIEKKDNLSNLIYFSIIFGLTLITNYIFNGVTSYTPSLCNDFDNFYRPFILGFLGIAFWLRISKILIPILKDNKIVNWVSKNTFSIMMHHVFGFFLLNTFFYIVSKLFGIASGFNYNEYYSNIWYNYLPKGLTNFRIFYLLAGFICSYIVSYAVNKLKEFITKYKNSTKSKKVNIIHF